MSKVIVVLAALLSVMGLMGAPLAGAGEVTPGAGPMPQIVAFDNEDFLGDHTHLFGHMKDPREVGQQHLLHGHPLGHLGVLRR